MCESCAYFVDNWIYGYQVYCTHPTEYWINLLGWVLIVVLVGCLIYFRLSQNNKKEDNKKIRSTRTHRHTRRCSFHSK